jgi:Flp pilus assembly protein TadG
VVEHVLVVPVVLLLTLIGVQAALALHAANVAASAAAQGAAAGAARGASPEQATEVASTAVVELGGRIGAPPRATVAAGEIVVEVEVKVPSVVPLFPTAVRRQAHEPIERFVSEPER